MLQVKPPNAKHSRVAVVVTETDPMRDEGSVLTVSADKKSIYCPDQSSMDYSSSNHQQPKFVVDMVCQGPGSSSTGVFDDEVRPLLKGMVEGSEEEKNACVISFGKSNEIGELVELPEGGGQGLIARSVAELLNVRQFLASDTASLTISWYRMQTESPESIVDLLNAAASAGLSTGAGTTGTGLRDDGIHVAVAGLWEVEVKSAQDAQNIIQQVQDNAVCRRLADGPRHSVLTLYLRGIWGAGPPAHTRGPLQNLKTDRVAKLSFMSLAPMLEPRGGPLSPASMLRPSWSSSTTPWVQIVSNLMTAMEAQHPNPPFKRLRLTTLLREVLRGDVRTAWLCVLEPSLENAPLSLASLRFAQQIKHIADGYVPQQSRASEAATVPKPALDIPDATKASKAVPSRKPPQPPVIEVLPTEASTAAIDLAAATTDVAASEVEMLPAFPTDEGVQQPAEDSLASLPPSSLLSAMDGDVALLVRQLEETCVQLQCERDALLQGRSVGDDPLTTQERRRLRKAERASKDHDIYKTVMEAAITKMKDEIEKLRLERDQYKRRMDQKEIAYTKMRRQAHDKQKRLTLLEQTLEAELKAGKAAREEANRLQAELTEAMKSSRIATGELAKAKDRVSEMQAEHEVEIAQLKRERDAMKEVLANPGTSSFTTAAPPRTPASVTQRVAGSTARTRGRSSANEVSDLRSKVEVLSSELTAAKKSYVISEVTNHSLRKEKNKEAGK